MIKLRQLFLLCFMLVASVALTSCSGGDDDSGPSKEALLTDGTWIMDDGDLEDDFEMTLRFNKNGTYATTYTDYEENESETGTWELTQKGTHLLMDDEFELKIKKLDSKNLILSEYDEEYDETYEVKFIKK